MSEIEAGLYAINVDGMVELLSNAYISLIEADLPFRKFPSAMLWGPPGVGKSQGVKQIARRIEDETGKEVKITDVRLLLFNPVDLRGIPTANQEKTLAIWLKPKIFQMDSDPSVVNLLFLDEISAAPPSVQAAAYQITLDRTVGEHKLPENCIVIAAGNRVSDKSVAYNMPKALANRMMHFEVRGDAESWHSWAVKKGVHPFVVGYLEYNPVALMKFDSSAANLAFPTPRSWELVSNILNFISEDVEKVYPIIIGCIGHDTASGFKHWVELYGALPSAKDICLGHRVDIPKTPELQLAIRSAIVGFVRKNPEKRYVDNAIAFACRLPRSFRVRLMQDFYNLDGARPYLRENEIYQTALEKGM